MPRPTLFILLSASLLLSLSIAGCRSAASWRRQADQRADQILSSVNADISSSSLETPADTLRRRLLLDQNLLSADPASLGIRDLPASELWDPEKRLLPSDISFAEGFNTASNATLILSLKDAVRIAAAHSPAFREQKEKLYSAALALDLESDAFRSAFSGKLKETLTSTRPDGGKSSKGSSSSSSPSASGSAQAPQRNASNSASPGTPSAALEATASSDPERDVGSTTTASLEYSRKFENGIDLSSSVAVDLARMLTGDKESSRGLSLEVSLSIPLLRGSGRLVVREPLTQAEHALLYAVRSFELYKQSFTIEVISAYLGVLNEAKQLQNKEDSYRRVITSTRRSRRMADAGRLQEYEFDQSYQQELTARNTWVAAQQSYQETLEAFRMTLGLPPDSHVELLPAELDSLQAYTESFARRALEAYNDGKPVPSADEDPILETPTEDNAGPMEIPLREAISLAFTNRLDLLTARDKVEDAQRAVLIAEDALRAEFTLGASTSAGESRTASKSPQEDAKLRLDRAKIEGILTLDLPFHRTTERNAYRESIIALEKAVRDYQSQEDSIKKEVSQKLRQLLENREKLSIQFIALSLAERRVHSTDLLLQSGRAEIRDVLDAQDALLSAQNALLSAVTGYRIGELELQQSIGVLKGFADGSWEEFDFSVLSPSSRSAVQ